MHQVNDNNFEDKMPPKTDPTAPNDSPESLDEEISQGLHREDVDPQHSIDRPAVNSINKEENGVS